VGSEMCIRDRKSLKHFVGVTEIKYEATMKVSELGCIDKAGNQWDVDGDTPNAWENKGIWRFRVSVSGDLTDFSEEYAEE